MAADDAANPARGVDAVGEMIEGDAGGELPGRLERGAGEFIRPRLKAKRNDP